MTSDDFWHKWIVFLVVENVGVAVKILQLGHSNEEICDLTAFSRCTAAILDFMRRSTVDHVGTRSIEPGVITNIRVATEIVSICKSNAEI